jgi:glycosyltransferase involved in cell wall biosynthesis
MKQNVIYIDISELYHHDHKTGIQRVVRSVLIELKIRTFKKYRIVPICWSDKNGLREYLVVDNENNLKERIEPVSNDIFFGLDLAGGVIHAHGMGLYKEWKKRGVKFYFIVYDLLPLFNKHWWPEGVYSHHSAWINVISSISDGLICISDAVKDDVEKWILINKPHLYKLVNITYFHLGADIDNSIPSVGIPVESKIVIESMQKRSSFLMVGTVEPRKGHEYTLKEFDKLWANNVDANLIIVGKEGWMMESFAKKVNNHREYNKRLFWLNGISDEYLLKIYSLSTCLLAASQGEGFGLPLIESAQRKIPIIARDIKVFREVGGNYVTYFDNKENKSLYDTIIKWLDMYNNNVYIKSDEMPWLTWKESTDQLIKCLKIN